MEKQIDTYKILYTPEEVDGVYGVSLVLDPANDYHFITLSKENDNQETIKLSSVGEKRLITGVVLIPNQKILRYDKLTKTEFYVEFGAEEIRMLSQDFFRKGYQKNSTLHHEDSQVIEGLTFVENWVIEDVTNDKSNALGFKGLKKGTWMMSAYIEDDAIWEKAKTGEVKGFSIDSRLKFEKVKMNKITNNKIKKEEKMSLLNRVIKMFSENANIKLASFESPEGLISADVFEVENVVYINDVPYVNAKFEYEGNLITTDSEGVITMVVPMVEDVVEEELALEDVPVEEVIAADVVEEVATVLEDALPQGEVIDYQLLVENLTKELTTVLEENVDMKLKLSKLPSTTKLKAEVLLSAPKGKESKLSAIKRIAK